MSIVYAKIKRPLAALHSPYPAHAIQIACKIFDSTKYRLIVSVGFLPLVAVAVDFVKLFV